MDHTLRVFHVHSRCCASSAVELVSKGFCEILRGCITIVRSGGCRVPDVVSGGFTANARRFPEAPAGTAITTLDGAHRRGAMLLRLHRTLFSILAAPAWRITAAEPANSRSFRQWTASSPLPAGQPASTVAPGAAALASSLRSCRPRPTDTASPGGGRILYQMGCLFHSWSEGCWSQAPPVLCPPALTRSFLLVTHATPRKICWRGISVRSIVADTFGQNTPVWLSGMCQLLRQDCASNSPR